MKTLYFIKSFGAKEIISFFVLIFLVVSFNCFVAKSAQAASLLDNQTGFSGENEIGKTFGEEQGPKDVRVVVASVIKVFLGFLGIIFLVLLVWAGFKWMTANGSEEQIKEAQGQIRTAIIGLIIVLASYAITNFVINNVICSVEGGCQGAIFGD